MQKINIPQNILLQNAISGELNAKVAYCQALKEELAQISAEYKSMTENERFLENEYYQLQMNQLEKEFYKKQIEFNVCSGFIRAIFVLPVYVN